MSVDPHLLASLLELFSLLVYAGVYTAGMILFVLLVRLLAGRAMTGRGRMVMWYGFLISAVLLLTLCAKGNFQRRWGDADGTTFPPLDIRFLRFSTVNDANILYANGSADLEIFWNGKLLAELDGVKFLLWAIGLWAAGAVVFYALHAASYFRLKRRLGKIPTCTEEWVLSMARAERGWRGESREMSIKVARQADFPEINCPCVVGFREKTLLLIREQWDALTPSEQEAAMAHEIMHIRKNDNYRNLILVIIHGLYWHNLLFWIAARLMRRDLEFLRDVQIAGELSREQTADYARAILRLAERFSRSWRPELSSMMLCRSGVGMRIRFLCDRNRRAAWGDFVFPWAVLILMALALFNKNSPGIVSDIYKII